MVWYESLIYGFSLFTSILGSSMLFAKAYENAARIKGEIVDPNVLRVLKIFEESNKDKNIIIGFFEKMLLKGPEQLTSVPLTPYELRLSKVETKVSNLNEAVASVIQKVDELKVTLTSMLANGLTIHAGDQSSGDKGKESNPGHG